MVACSECKSELCGNSVDIIEKDYDEDIFERNLLDLFYYYLIARYFAGCVGGYWH